jgi:hypothetical protein
MRAHGDLTIRLLLVLGFSLAMGCSGCKKKPPPPDAGGPVATLKPPPPESAGVGTIRGSVAFEGAPPNLPPIQRTPDCGGQGTDESILVNPNKTLRNVIVRLTEGADWEYPPPQTPLQVRQVKCTYTPHVQAGMVSQPLTIYNDDPILHNVHTFRGDEEWFNRPQPAIRGAPPIEKKLENGIGLITFKCDVHPFMRAYVSVTRHPFFAVTAEDGSFTIGKVPPGSYTLEAWHEKLGSKKMRVTVERDKTAEAKFSFGS